MLARMSRHHEARRRLVRLTLAAVVFLAALGAGWSSAAPAEEPPGAPDATALLDWAFSRTDSSCEPAGGSQVAASP